MRPAPSRPQAAPAARKTPTKNRWAMLLHIVNHKNYHRGFVADMLYQLPATPPTTDLPVYLRDVHREAALAL
ncbi:DinB family protein [Chromobacterium amazonense]|uniref:DinB family protein n=1 Tax=Chromobacterium amazonense TaxID=1382803 RepID=UPI0021B745A8|nr:DinB family protein [Chromobacterium amazonense]